MRNKIVICSIIVLTLLFGLSQLDIGNLALFAILVTPVFAHCDTMDGPVVKAAQKALDSGKINLILMWVKKKEESKIIKAFEETLAARKKDKKADLRFFEDLVRAHREGEGEKYTGIKPAGTKIEPGIEAADKALESGSVDKLAKEISGQVEKKIKNGFDRVIETKKHMNDSVEAGREYVEAYVAYIHFIESLHEMISGKSAEH